MNLRTDTKLVDILMILIMSVYEVHSSWSWLSLRRNKSGRGLDRSPTYAHFGIVGGTF